MQRRIDSDAKDGLDDERSPLNSRFVVREQNVNINMRRLSVTEVEGVSQPPPPPEHMPPPASNEDAAAAAGSELHSSTHVEPSSSAMPVHCHGPVAPADPVARNQLIIISVLCFIFMVAEVVGEFSSCSAVWTSFGAHVDRWAP